jgi:hypothetical protein
MNPINRGSARRLLHRTLPLFGVAALGLVLGGCAGRILSVPPVISPEAALHALAVSKTHTLALTATSRIDISRRGERYPLKAAIMMKRPDFLRVESIPIMGPADFYLSVAGGELRVFLPEKGAFYTGRATASSISRFFPVSMPAADMVCLLMGAPPDDAQPIQSMYADREEGLYRVDQYQSGKIIRALWIEPQGGRLIRVRSFTQEQKVVYTAEFEDFTRIGEGFLPQLVTIRMDETTALTIRHRDLRQIDFDPESFPLPLPDGVVPIPLGP